MQLLVKGTRRIIFILCAVSDAKRYYSSPSNNASNPAHQSVNPASDIFAVR